MDTPQSDLITEGKKIIARVKAGLAQRLQRFDSGEDLRSIFTTAYQIATAAVQAKIVEGKEFHNPKWLANLADRFARYYFEASDAYDYGHYEQVPLVWVRVFEVIGAGQPVWRHAWKVTTLEALVLPLLVHTIHDLPLAVADELLRAKHPQAHIHDFEKINNLIAQEIEAVQTALAQKYDPILLYLDRWAGWYDEFLTYHLLQLLRGMAWFNATRLFEARKEQLRLQYQLKTTTQSRSGASSDAERIPLPAQSRRGASPDAEQTSPSHDLNLLRSGASSDAERTSPPAQSRNGASSDAERVSPPPHDLKLQLAEADKRYQLVKTSIVKLTMTYLDMVLNPPWPLKLGLTLVRFITGLLRLAALLAQKRQAQPQKQKVYQAPNPPTHPTP
jgi:hypothetical protein